MKKLVGILSAGVMILMLLMAQGLAEVTIEPLYEDSARLTATLSISGGVANCAGSAKPSDSAHSATVIVKLQQDNNGNWKTLATWSGSANSGNKASASGSKSVESGYSYRVYVTATVKNADGSVVEQPSKASNTVAY